jgi:hypothetical protein
MTIIFIENVFGSGQVITVREAFDDHVVEHRLHPGESARIAISRFKSIIVDEAATAAADRSAARLSQACA